jgi:drug/metabolite transporter (DMT)-like permease
MSLFENRKEFIGVLICLASAVIYGLYPPAARGVYQEGGNITYVILVTTSCQLAGLYTLALVKKHRPFQNIFESKTSLYAGIFKAISIIGILGGAYFMPGAIVIIIMCTYSLMLLFFCAWRGDMKLNVANILSTLTALAGLGMVLNIVEYGVAFRQLEYFLLSRPHWQPLQRPTFSVSKVNHVTRLLPALKHLPWHLSSYCFLFCGMHPSRPYQHSVLS